MSEAAGTFAISISHWSSVIGHRSLVIGHWKIRNENVPDASCFSPPSSCLLHSSSRCYTYISVASAAHHNRRWKNR
jgi:hypothetical protein